jgi:hypothetical protein
MMVLYKSLLYYYWILNGNIAILSLEHSIYCCWIIELSWFVLMGGCGLVISLNYRTLQKSYYFQINVN